MRIIQRNKYRIPAITTSLDTLLKEAQITPATFFSMSIQKKIAAP